MEKVGSNWTDFHEILNLSIFRKAVEKIQVSLNRTIIKGTLFEDQYRFLSYLVLFFLELKMFRTKVVHKLETHIYVQ